MLISEKEKMVIDYLVKSFSSDEKPIPFHEDELKIEGIEVGEISGLVDSLYEKGLVFILEPEKNEDGEVKVFEKQAFVISPDAVHNDY